MRRVKWNDAEGWFHRFITAGDGDGVPTVIAIVELDHGLVTTVEVGQWASFRFVTPYKPHGDWEPQPLPPEIAKQQRVFLDSLEGELAQAELDNYDALNCDHIYTGHQHDEPMTQNADSRDSADLPGIQ